MLKEKKLAKHLDTQTLIQLMQRIIKSLNKK